MGKGLRVVMSAVGLEPTANQLKVDCSTTELRGHLVIGIKTLFKLSYADALDRLYAHRA